MKKNNFNFVLAVFLFALCVNQAKAQSSVQNNLTTENIPTQNDNQKLTVDKIDQNAFSGTAVLQGLDKINAKTSELRIKIGSQIQFGKLTIKAKKCWRSPPDQRPENKILLEVEETNNEGIKKTIFNGWMFSSSPSISGIEHPVYDITAIECKN